MYGRREERGMSMEKEKTFEELEEQIKKNFEILDECDETLEIINRAMKVIKEEE